jgi:uroporphyrinogen-III decarboxylase
MKMHAETMTMEERFWAAVNLKECDRVPVGLPLSWFTARHAGITMADFANDLDANVAAQYKAFEDLGGFDIIPILSISIAPALIGSKIPMKKKYPGRELPDDSIIQYNEQEIMTVDEYDIVIKKGWSYYDKEYLTPRIHPEFSGPSGAVTLEKRTGKINRVVEKARHFFSKKGVVLLEGVNSLPPFEILSMVRSFNPFLFDLFRRPDKVIEVMDTMQSENIDTLSSQLRDSKEPFGFTALSRSASTFISPKQFERFVFPYVKKIVDVFMEHNITLVFHLDQNWLKFLPYFRELPEGKYILQLDGATDIFEAKNIVGDRMCLMGDVPARMFKLGTVRDIEQYCEKLIDIVGKGSGFILSPG